MLQWGLGCLVSQGQDDLPLFGKSSVLKHVVSYEDSREMTMLIKSTGWWSANPFHSFVLHGIFLIRENPCTEILSLCRVVLLLSGCVFFERLLFKPVYTERRGWVDGIAGFHGLVAPGSVYNCDSSSIRVIWLWYVVISIASINLEIRSIEDLRASFQE